MTSTLRGGGRVNKCSGRPIFIFFIKEKYICVIPDIMLSQTLIYNWDEIFLLTLTSDSEPIL